MVIHEDLPDVTEYLAYIINVESGFMYVNGHCYNGQKKHSNPFLIHSGYSGTILLDDGFASRSGMSELEVVSETALKDSYGNVLKKKKSVLPLFELEDFQFENLHIGFFEGKIGNQKNSIIGGELLKRFNMIIDRVDRKV
ncbi:hypothetical protein [Portibacter marinus]|uniref:hypothetical protein n=1 Tax=Portibacter marinus TaxID=2898660 RepID=UPI001F358BC8|nr:hypothetical protein [Portibacter marinus]